MYNPKQEIFNSMRQFDRPLTAAQIQKALPAIPNGTVSSSLFTLKKIGVIKEVREEGSRAKLYRTVATEFPKNLSESRLSSPVQRHTRKTKKVDAVLLMIPLPKGQSAVVTMDEAKRIYEALAPLFKG